MQQAAWEMYDDVRRITLNLAQHLYIFYCHNTFFLVHFFSPIFNRSCGVNLCVSMVTKILPNIDIALYSQLPQLPLTFSDVKCANFQ